VHAHKDYYNYAAFIFSTKNFQLFQSETEPLKNANFVMSLAVNLTHDTLDKMKFNCAPALSLFRLMCPIDIGQLI